MTITEIWQCRSNRVVDIVIPNLNNSSQTAALYGLCVVLKVLGVRFASIDCSLRYLTF